MPVNVAMHPFAFLRRTPSRRSARRWNRRWHAPAGTGWVAGTAAAFLLAIELVAAPASACRCMPPSSPLESMRGASAVFEGTVIATRQGDRGWVIDFRVTQAWKGVTGETVVVTTAENGARCGVEFQQGQSYLVYAGADGSAPGSLETNLCTRTRPTDQAGDDFAALGPGAVTFDPASAGTADLPTTQVSRGGCASCRIGHGSERNMPLTTILGAGMLLGLLGLRRFRR